MHQIATHHPVAIEAHVVVGLALGGSPRHRTDVRCHVEDRDQGGFIAEAILQTLLIGADPLVPVDVKPDGVDAGGIQSIERVAEQTVVDRPPEALNVTFFDPHQGDWRVLSGPFSPLAGDQVVQHQINGLGQAGAAQQNQHHHGGQIGPSGLDQLANALHPSR